MCLDQPIQSTREPVTLCFCVSADVKQLEHTIEAHVLIWKLQYLLQQQTKRLCSVGARCGVLSTKHIRLCSAIDLVAKDLVCIRPPIDAVLPYKQRVESNKV